MFNIGHLLIQRVSYIKNADKLSFCPLNLGGTTLNILFWDIDGTLLNTGRAGLYAIEEGFSELQGKKVTVPPIAAGGRTDNYICQQLLFKATGKMPAHADVSAFCRRYEKLLLKWISKTDGQVFPLVREILPFFAERSDFKQVLLTGNSEYGARLKLDAYELSSYFDFAHSGFACDFYYRDDMARHAYKLVQQAWGDAIENIFVIGDTPYDIQCGKAIYAKTVAVSTGHYTAAQLKQHTPWWLVEHLPCPEEMLKKFNS